MSMIHSARSPGSRAPMRWRRKAEIQVVPAVCHGVVSPPRGSGITLHGVAERGMQWWPHRRQRQLYAKLMNGTLPLRLLVNGREAARFGHDFVMVSRAADGLTIQAVFDRWPEWED
ncbi:hypothetical protein ACFJIX_12945 [Roseateles sp. UC29_93]|uniref:hypothetical protein n=1 Tax=Roseateles sp. UC29_93 TaxID=3350177 RepID=UPI003670B8B9